MSCSFSLHTLCSPTNYYSSKPDKSQTLSFKSQSIQFKPLLKPRLLSVQSRKFSSRIYAVQSGFFKALQTAYKVGKDGIEAGTTLVPESIPRPIARISVAVIGSTVLLFLLKSFLSTAFFVLATMGLIYLAFIALNKDEGPTGGSDTTNTTGTTTSTEDSLEEARRIMEKVGKDGIEAGTTLVPESIPRPIARISVAVIGSTVLLFLLKSFLSAAFFVLATMGLIYLAFIALNKDEGPTGGSDTTNTTGTTTSTEDSLEEARRIMEKYK
ncbi:hypothetical protein CTI12_AA183340 [Artemisia annua]|uniref:Transmembrane protein n=1 Tax=Artemisia annua TaxID=35608 RepID=A0A2U1P748_ARTAN|nr:hypothetical protein CTI12_AA183340 [Artemisia annua]